MYMGRGTRAEEKGFARQKKLTGGSVQMDG